VRSANQSFLSPDLLASPVSMRCSAPGVRACAQAIATELAGQREAAAVLAGAARPPACAVGAAARAAAQHCRGYSRSMLRVARMAPASAEPAQPNPA